MRIEGEARRLGCELFGVTTPDSPPHFEVFKDWLADSRHGEMDYLAKESAVQRRGDPRQILPGCRSILVLGMRYPSANSTASPSTQADEEGVGPGGSSQAPASRLRGRVASYAWSADYHSVLANILQALAAFIAREAGRPVAQRWYTDTGPVLERDLAQRAGLGWVGKNTCLIHPHKGSYFLLAEMLLDLELEPDPPFEADRCGSCTRCLEACPTQCILPDRTIDARRCISYLTIELKGAIAPALRPLMGNWVFGCDICQQVCPWNTRFSLPVEGHSPPIHPELAPRPGVTEPDLTGELSLTTEAFNRKFKGSPVRRAKRRGYLRNVAVALGNSGDPAAVPALSQALLHDREPLVRRHAAWALGRIGGADARRALEEGAACEMESDVQPGS